MKQNRKTYAVPETKLVPEMMAGPKRDGDASNHQFSETNC